MPLPPFEKTGDLTTGLYRATLEEVLARFGTGSSQRQAVASRLLRIYRAARETNRLERFIIFGSFVTTKPDPNDVDIILVMRDDFVLDDCTGLTRKLFEHIEAEQEFGASIFWIRPSLLLLDTLDEFLSHWQIKRDRTRRGIVEVIE
jgi:predicted nucleotidyltransferase